MRVLALDPGECSGYCIIQWDHMRQIKPREDLASCIITHGQIASRDLVKQHQELERLITTYNPDIIVYEKFLLYGHKAAAQIGSDMYTPQVVGQIKVLCAKYNKREISNSAQNAKLFYTDKKLKEHNMWQVGMKHCRDSIRHALYAIDFNLCKPKRR